jgi:hypothetical protein
MDLSKQKKPSLPRLATAPSSDRQSTISLPTLAPKIPAEINIYKLPKSERQAIAPFLFPEDDKDDENVAPIKHDVQESKPAYEAYKSFDEEFPTTTNKKTMYYEDAFAIRGPSNSPKERVAQDSVVIAELTTNLKVCCPIRTHPFVSLTFDYRRDCGNRIKSKMRGWPVSLESDSLGSISVQCGPCRWWCGTMPPSSLTALQVPHTC